MSCTRIWLVNGIIFVLYLSLGLWLKIKTSSWKIACMWYNLICRFYYKYYIELTLYQRSDSRLWRRSCLKPQLRWASLPSTWNLCKIQNIYDIPRSFLKNLSDLGTLKFLIHSTEAALQWLHKRAQMVIWLFTIMILSIDLRCHGGCGFTT